MVWGFEERAEEMGQRSVVKEASGFAEELGVEFHLEHPRKVKTELQKCQVPEAKRGSKKSEMVGKSSNN